MLPFVREVLADDYPAPPADERWRRHSNLQARHGALEDLIERDRHSQPICRGALITSTVAKARIDPS